jgi:nitrogen regulatory protein PII
VSSDIEEAAYELIYVIVSSGMGSKVIKEAKRSGIAGATVMLGKGTVKNPSLDYLGLSDIRKEIVLMVSGKDTARNAMGALNGKFRFDKPGHGIAFTTAVCEVTGTSSCRRCITGERGGDTVYNVITIIVDKGKAENVIDAAVKAGSKGGTIINARGSGIHETSKLFSMSIEPEKEIVLIISERSGTEAIIDSIREDLKIEEPGNGIIYVQQVSSAYGLYE